MFVVAGPEFPTTRKARWIADSLRTKPIPGIHLEPPDSLAEHDLLTIHDEKYVQAVRTGEPRALAESNELRWDEKLWPMVLASNGGALAAAKRAMRDGIAGSLSSGLHHARRERGHGYCTFNGLAIAAEAALSDGSGDVLILDLDAGLCLYNAGMDPHEDCSQGALAGITNEHLQAREAMVFEWCREQHLPVAFVMAGGYLKPPRMDEARLVDLHRLTLTGAAQYGWE